MRKCSSCGFNNPEARERCLKCSTVLVSQVLPDGGHVRTLKAEFHPLVPLRRAWFFLWEKVRGRIPEGVPYRYPWTAAYLSLMLGAGQWYNRQRVKAVVFGLIQIALFAWCIATIRDPRTDWIALLLVFWHFYMMADGCIVAYKINGEHATLRHVAAVWFAMMFFLGVVLSVGQITAQAYLVFFLTTLRTESLAPGFRKGDKLFVIGWPLFFGKKPRHGSVVYYNPPRYEVYKPTLRGLSTDEYSVNERNSFGVVQALQGDLLRVDENGAIFVNDNPISAKQLPINTDGAHYLDPIRIQKDQYGILITHGTREEGFLSFLGGSFGGSVPNPREASLTGLRVKRYDEASQVEEDAIYGVVLFCAYPPERRRWFGFDGGLWTRIPDDYPPGLHGK